MNQQKQITLIGLSIIASVIASPFVYAAVEPHIILVMDAGQTTAPFTIQENSGADIYSINSDGQQFSKYSRVGFNELEYHSLGNTTSIVLGVNTISDPIILKQYAITHPELTLGFDHPLVMDVYYSGVAATDTSASIKAGVCVSTDGGTTWTEEVAMQKGSLGAWDGQSYYNTAWGLNGGETDLALCLFSPTGGGVWAELTLQVKVSVPYGFVFTEV